MKALLPTIKAAALLLVGASLSGCIVAVESDTSYRHGSRALDSLGEVQSGQTSREWVVDNLGTPDSAYVSANGNEVLRYLSRREVAVDVAILLLFSFDVSEEELRTLHIEIEDDVVKGFWVE